MGGYKAYQVDPQHLQSSPERRKKQVQFGSPHARWSPVVISDG